MHEAAFISWQAEEIAALRSDYARRWGFSVCLVDPEGRHVGACSCSGDEGEVWREARRHALEECLRWGEGTIYDRPEGFFLWGVPLMVNASTVGGLIVAASQEILTEGIRRGNELLGAARELRLQAENLNLVNAALLAQRRVEYEKEQNRATTIHQMKTMYGQDLMRAYVQVEPELISAIRREDREGAVNILNSLLVVLYHRGSGNLDLVKSLALELVVTMSRTAVESGQVQQELLGTNYAHITSLSEVKSEEEMSRWLVTMLDRIMDSMGRPGRKMPLAIVRDTLSYINEHLSQNIGRDDAARAVGVSPSHFSRTIAHHTGWGFNELLAQARVEKAAQLLRETDKSLVQIALESGFNDQSYFSKVFKKLMRTTPRQYRLGHS
ncbi:MAG: helix-turn-helix transcriptional regulator [Planctomycetes bacterium]|nr:helix-turn-helix transcriptional regulator [Planctomycetota bacterium]